MPRIMIRDPFGMTSHCDTRSEAILKDWFDEILPYTFTEGSSGEKYWPRIDVWPMVINPSQEIPDWLIDTRVLSRWEEFPARNGEEGLRELRQLRERLERELKEMK